MQMEMIIYRIHTMCQVLTSELIFSSFNFHYNPEEKVLLPCFLDEEAKA